MFARCIIGLSLGMLGICAARAESAAVPATAAQVLTQSDAAAIKVIAPEIEPYSAKRSRFAENPIVYFLFTDRFHNGNPDNDASYGRARDGKQEIGTFHGGDLAGITAKLKEGYFEKLGVNALWITAPYEQIHGWVVGGRNEFRHYAYHGYFALDYTVLDKNMGTPAELREMIDTAHAQGIRVLFDVIMNHPGYGDLRTLSDYGIDAARPDWERLTPANYNSFVDYRSPAWAGWWGPDWVRAGLGGGYEEGDPGNDRTMQVNYLPDFKTESTAAVGLPPLLRNKPDTRAKPIPGFTVRQYLVKWLTDWVREYGVDGFRADTAKHVEFESWALLREEGSKALREWKAKNPDKKIDDADFWMVAEVFPHGVSKSAYFTRGRFDSVLNFDFQAAASDLATIESTYASMAEALSEQKFDVLSYISSHDTRLFSRKNLYNGGTALLLAPGGVQIFYGDETARPTGPAPRGDRQQATRSSMNWNAVDDSVQAHWRILTQFRLRHPAVARGEHRQMSASPYVFSRSLGQDRIVAAIGVAAESELGLTPVFADGQTVRDAYTGSRYVVAGGKVRVKPGATGVVLLEAAP